ncbi:outer membrane protein assembly factor BamA [Algimonas porphyrae]|uniref:Outer membrane protein assembly factor BamA n=1 Tax=Algimonas porphyrae TaxID=1128113 RepID=A0ABQ5UYT0_9PROT|nr:outer membrane protein assembly factor BamA [Algimonas porphyrae]GLQ20293.1 outer membrane protein assembly factor BamA [Algimonas porphyrae]
MGPLHIRTELRTLSSHCASLLFVLAILGALALPGAASARQDAAAAAPETAPAYQPPTRIRSIQVTGNQRVEANTVASYLLFSPGDPYSEERIDLSLKTLYSTGLFADVLIDPRDGNVLIQVIENPIINRVVFEGNRSLKSDKINDEISAEPRSLFTRAQVQEDVQRIIELYRQSGRFGATVEPKVVEQPQNRVDLIFEISEGPVTGVKSINFIGNTEFSDRKLRKEIATSESSWYKFFDSNDNYDPARLEFDREQLRTFYTNRGFADFRVVSAVAELTPDQEDFYITFTLDEGGEYRWGDISVETELEALNKDFLERLVNIEEGEVYNSSQIENAIDNLNFAAGTSGYAFVDIQQDLRLDRETKTVDLVFNVVEGPRVYIERIDIVGNTTTLDYVIRRELELVEGDAFNRILLDRSRNRVRALRFFEEVEIEESQGSSPDRAVVEVRVTEQPTGELSFSAGFSSADAFLVDLSITQRNLRGRGQLLRAVIRASSNRREIDLRFTEPRFLGRNLAGSIELFDVVIDFLDEAGFRSTRTGGQVSLAFPLTQNTSLSARYSLRSESIEFPQENQCDQVLQASQTGQLSAQSTQLLSLCQQVGGRLSSIFGYTFGWDRRNDPITPTGGFDARFSQDVAGIGGDVRYLRTDVRGNYYKGLFPGVIASASLSGGYIRGWGGDPVQINDRYFKGNFDFRGFDNAGIGPRVVNYVAETGSTLIPTAAGGFDGRAQAQGGNLFGLAAAEVSFPVGLPQLLGSFFIEAGTVGLLDESFQYNIITDPGASGLTAGASCDGVTAAGVICQRTVDTLDPRVTAGASIFWESPFGPIRFDFAQPIVKQPFDDRQSFQFTTRTRF